jgi:hypothetical protein
MSTHLKRDVLLQSGEGRAWPSPDTLSDPTGAPTGRVPTPPSLKEPPMPRIIVTTDPSQLADEAPVLLDESVHSVHLSTGHAAAQLVERLSWAISDA